MRGLRKPVLWKSRSLHPKFVRDYNDFTVQIANDCMYVVHESVQCEVMNTAGDSKQVRECPLKPKGTVSIESMSSVRMSRFWSANFEKRLCISLDDAKLLTQISRVAEHCTETR